MSDLSPDTVCNTEQLHAVMNLIISIGEREAVDVNNDSLLVLYRMVGLTHWLDETTRQLIDKSIDDDTLGELRAVYNRVDSYAYATTWQGKESLNYHVINVLNDVAVLARECLNHLRG